MPKLTAYIPPKTHAFRSDMDPVKLRKEIITHGLRLTWEMASECPCFRDLTLAGGGTTITSRTDEKRPDCAACDGSGWYHHSSQEIKALTLGAETTPDGFQVYGYKGTGTIRLTMLPEHLPGFMDRFTLKDSVMTYTDIVTRTSETIEKTRYPIVVRDLALGSEANPSVTETKSIGVLSIRKTNTSGVVDTAELVENTDFTVTSDGKIDWTLGMVNGTAPEVGSRYSVHHYARPVYIAKSFPYSFRDTRVINKEATDSVRNLPVRVDCMLEFLG